MDFRAWSDTWLKTAGPAELELRYEIGDDERITRCELIQTPYKPDVIKDNILRRQKIDIGALSSEMLIEEVITVETSETQQAVLVDHFLGKKAPHAFLMNHGAYGYGKFIIDERTLSAIEPAG